MRRIALLLPCVVGLGVCPSAYGQRWADEMFPIKRHDFGTVARGAKAEFEFPLKNIYVEDVHIASVRASCGCTTPWIKDDRRTLKTYQAGAIVAHLNSGTFLGNRGATLTVTIDKPFYAEVQLQVAALVRSDVVLEPGSVQFGSVDQGAAADRQVAVRLPGRPDLRILSVKSSSPYLSARAVPDGRDPSQPSYQLAVHLDKSAPAGYLRDQLTLVTSDYQANQISVPVEGRVTPGVTVSPAWLLLGVVQPGQKVTKQVVVQGKEPFTIKQMLPDTPAIQFDLSAEKEPKRVHVVPVTFIAGTEPSKVTQAIRVETDRPGVTADFVAQAVVAAPEGILARHNDSAATKEQPKR